jgi:hypothetical protein
VFNLDAHDGTSNLEAFIQRLAEAASHRAAQTPAEPTEPKSIEVEIVDGIILGRDYGSGQQWRIDQLSATAKPTEVSDSWEIIATGIMTLAATPPLSAAAQRAAGAPQLELASGSSQAGRFKLHLHSDAGAGDGPARQELEIIADRLPLAPIEPWLARLIPQARLTGEASTDLKITFTSPSEPGRLGPGEFPFNLTANGKLDASSLRFTAASLSGDLVEFPSASITLDAALADRRLVAKQCSARSDWLQAELNGAFDLAELRQLSLKSLPASDATVTARANLPELTRMLPRTLNLRSGVRVDAGKLEITARSAKGDRGRQWTVAAAVDNLIGNDGARPIRWTKPVEFGFDAVESPSGPQLQRAIFHAAFANISADGAGGGLEGRLDFNLDELADQLGQFVDLSAWKLHGSGDGQFSWRETTADRFAASAMLNLRQIDVERSGKVVWQDPDLHVDAQAAGSLQNFKPQRLETASVTMRGPTDTLSGELVEPVDLVDFNQTWLLKVNGNGPLELWSGRLRPWVAAVPERLAGQTKLSAQVRAQKGLIQVSESKLSVQNLKAQLGQNLVEEPRVEALGDFRWDAIQRAIDSQDLQFSSSTVAARAQGLSVRLSDSGPPIVRGEVAFRGDLERVAAWLNAVGPSNDGLRPRGQAVGRLTLASDSTRASANLSLTATPFQLASPASGADPGPGAPQTSLAWDEPKLELTTEAIYTHADDRLQLANLRLTGKTVQMNGAGVVEQLRTAAIVRGDMNVSYDAAELAKLLTAYLGPNVQFQGANTARLQAAGRLRSTHMEAPGSVGGLAAVRRTPPSAMEITWNGIPSTGDAGGSQPSSLQPPASSLSFPWSRNWQITAETGWAAANFYGLPVGAARLTASLSDGQIQFTPLDLTVGQGGRISLQPRVFLDPPPQRLELAPGQIISNVAISPEVSQRMLKYAAPIVAGATQTEGAFSFFLEGADIPLRQPKQGRLKGRLTVHRLSITPGPMIQDIATLVRQIDALGKNAPGAGGPLGLGLLGGAAQPAQPIKGVTMSERAIDVTVVDGRVYHQNLEFIIDDVPVRSKGSVGFDETLALLIEVPIQQKWVGKRPALQQLVGQPLQIPVGGTLSKPQIDNRAIGQFAAQAAQAAAGNIIGDELNKALDKLLKPR